MLCLSGRAGCRCGGRWIGLALAQIAASWKLSSTLSLNWSIIELKVLFGKREIVNSLIKIIDLMLYMAYALLLLFMVHLFKTWLLGFILLFIGLFLYFVVLKPIMLTFGANDQDIDSDHYIPKGKLYYTSTRGIEIHAHPQVIWMWISQLGSENVGIFTYPLIERWLGRKHINYTQTFVSKNRREVGDSLPIDKKYFSLKVIEMIPNRVINCGHWQFLIIQKSPNLSKLLIKTYAFKDQRSGQLAQFTFWHLLFTPIHYFCERKTLLTIKTLVESSSLSDDIENLAAEV